MACSSLGSELQVVLAGIVDFKSSDSGTAYGDYIEESLLKIFNRLPTNQLTSDLVITLLNILKLYLDKCSAADLEIVLKDNISNRKLAELRAVLFTSGDALKVTDHAANPKTQKKRLILEKFSPTMQNGFDETEMNLKILSEDEEFVRAVGAQLDKQEAIRLVIGLIEKAVTKDNVENKTSCAHQSVISVLNALIGLHFQCYESDSDLSVLKGLVWMELLAITTRNAFTIQPFPVKDFYPILTKVFELTTKSLGKGLNNDVCLRRNYKSTCLLLYLINNLYFLYNANDSAQKIDLLEILQKHEEGVIELIIFLVASQNYKQWGLNLFGLVMTINCGFKETESLNMNKSMAKKKGIKGGRLKTTKPIHHKPVLGSFKKYACVTENMLFRTFSLLDLKRQRKTLRTLKNFSLCCCNVNAENISILYEICRSHQKLTMRVLNLIRNQIYYLMFKTGNECGFCSEKVNANEVLKNELVSFYKNAMTELPRKGVLLHLSRLPKNISFSLHSKIIFEVVWRHFLAEKRILDSKPGKVHANNVIMCLKMFSAYMGKKQAIRLLIDTDFILQLTQLIMNSAFAPSVCEIIVIALEGSALLGKTEDESSYLVKKVMTTVIETCKHATEMVWVFARAKEEGGEKKVTAIDQNIVMNLELNPLRFGTISNCLTIAVHLWNTILRILQSEDAHLQQILNEEFYQIDTIFALLYSTLKFILNVDQAKMKSKTEFDLDFELASSKLDCFHLDPNSYLLIKILNNQNENKITENHPEEDDFLRHQKPRTNVLPEICDLNWCLEMTRFIYEETSYPILPNNEILSCDPKLNKNNKQNYFLAAVTIIETVKTINHFLRSSLLSLVLPYITDEEEEAENHTEFRKLCEEFSRVEVTDEIKWKFGQHFEAILGVFVTAIYSREEFSKYLYSYIYFHSILLTRSFIFHRFLGHFLGSSNISRKP